MAEKVKKMPKLPIFKADSFPLLTDAINGFIPGELIVITGGTKCGKSLLCHSFIRDLSQKHIYPMLLSYEVAPRYFINKFSLLLQFYMPEEMKRYSIAWICELVRRGKKEKDIEVIFIDHLHYIFELRTQQASLEIGDIMRTLKQLALETDTVIFIVCHTTKARIEKSDDIGIHSLRDSSFVAQESDTALFIHRSQESNAICTTNEAYLKVLTARRTGVMGKTIAIKKRGEFLEECEEETV